MLNIGFIFTRMPFVTNWELKGDVPVETQKNGCLLVSLTETRNEAGR